MPTLVLSGRRGSTEEGPVAPPGAGGTKKLDGKFRVLEQYLYILIIKSLV